MSKYLHHVTLDTGDVGTFLRSTMSDAAMAHIAPHLRRAVENGRDTIPTTDYKVMTSAAQSFLLATIFDAHDTPILTFGVATKSRSAGRLWELLTKDRPLGVEPGSPPPPPWLAARMEPGASFMTLQGWMPDYERCIAWAWIEGAAK